MSLLLFFSHCKSCLEGIWRKAHWLSATVSQPDSDNLNDLPDLTGSITSELPYPVAHGSLGDVWKCTYASSSGFGQHQEVAVKTLRIEVTSDDAREKITQILLRNYRIWKQLRHENLLPLLGLSHGFGPLPAMISPWMHNGSLAMYLSKNFTELNIDRKLLILQQVAEAISYLHSKDIVHGDLTAGNILIDSTCTAHVTDHGILALYSELAGTSYIRSNVRWAAPELFEAPESDDSLPPPKKASDIYSFGCIMLQVMTGQIPYAEIRSDHQVTVLILRGKKPGRPSTANIEDSFWNFIEKCWSELENRPTASDVLSFLQSLS